MQTEVLTRPDTTTEVKEPSMFAVYIHNDDITTQDFVVEILVRIFDKSSVEAVKLMLAVHNEGRGLAGIYTYDIAYTKKHQADAMSRERGFPLKLTLEEA